MKKYKLKTTLIVGQQIMDRTFNYCLPSGSLLEEKGYAYVGEHNVWFDKPSVENNPDIFELITE